MLIDSKNINPKVDRILFYFIPLNKLIDAVDNEMEWTAPSMTHKVIGSSHVCGMK